MAATDAMPVPKKNTAYRHYFSVRKNDGTLITTWAGQDSEVSLDGASFTDATNEATEIGTSGCGYIELTAAEMNYDAVILKVVVTNTDALTYVVTFFPEEAGDIRTDVTQLGSDTQSATDLKDFADSGYDPSTNKVQGVVLCDTTTTNTDMYSSVMRGTDSAFLAASAPTNFSSLGINVSGHVSRVTLVDTTTTNTDMYSSVMRGTDSAFLAASAPTNFSDLAVTVSTGYVTAHTESLSTAAKDNVAATVWNKDISGITTADYAGYLLQRLTNYTAGTINTDSVFGQIMWNAISPFDRTTDSLQALRDRGDSAWVTATGFATSSALTTIGGNVDDILVDTAVIGAAGAGLTDLGGMSTGMKAEVNAECDTALSDYDAPTKAEMDAMWTTVQTESYATDGETATPAQLLYMILCSVSEFAISSTTITGKKLDGSTTAMTWTIDDATSPTSRTRAS